MKWFLDTIPTRGNSDPSTNSTISVYLTAGSGYDTAKRLEDQLENIHFDMPRALGKDSLKDVNLVVSIDEVSNEWDHKQYGAQTVTFCWTLLNIKAARQIGWRSILVGRVDREVVANQSHMKMLKRRCPS